MNDAIDHRNLVEQLRHTFPEIEPLYQEELRLFDGDAPGNYNILGFAFMPYFKGELAKGEITDFIRRSAVFMERVCASGDIEAINVIWLKVFKLLFSVPTELIHIWPILGPATKAEIRDAASRWDLLKEIPH